MKKLLISLMLISSGLAFAGEAEDYADGEAGERLGMTLEGYRASAQYQRDKGDKENADRCRRLRNSLEQRDRDQNARQERLEQRQSRLDSEKSSLDFRRQLILATPGGASQWLVNQYNNDLLNNQGSYRQLNRDIDLYNKYQGQFDEDVDEYNNECVR